MLVIFYLLSSGPPNNVVKLRTAVQTQTTIVSGVWCCHKKLTWANAPLHNVFVFANFASWKVGNNTMHNHQFGIVQIDGLLWHVQLMHIFKIVVFGQYVRVDATCILGAHAGDAVV